MANKLKITHNDGATDKQVSPILIGGQPIGGTGGLTSQTGSQIQPQVYCTGGSSVAGSILRQKGARKFYCTDGTRSQTLTLVNNPTLAAGQMNILINLNNSGAANITAANVAGGATSAYVTTDTRTPPTGPIVTARIGDYFRWSSPSANIGSVVQVTAVNGTGNVTIGVTGNIVAVTGLSTTLSTYATRITNRTVTDYNGARFFYRLAAPTTTYVQVNAA
jgi:hypothetical protein